MQQISKRFKKLHKVLALFVAFAAMSVILSTTAVVAGENTERYNYPTEITYPMPDLNYQASLSDEEYYQYTSLSDPIYDYAYAEEVWEEVDLPDNMVFQHVCGPDCVKLSTYFFDLFNTRDINIRVNLYVDHLASLSLVSITADGEPLPYGFTYSYPMLTVSGEWLANTLHNVGEYTTFHATFSNGAVLEFAVEAAANFTPFNITNIGDHTILVSEIDFDNIGVVLNRMNIPHIQLGGITNNVANPSVALINDANFINQFDIIFLNCGAQTTPQGRQNLRTFVYNGGRLYASDLQFDAFLDPTFPERQFQSATVTSTLANPHHAIVTNPILAEFLGGLTNTAVAHSPSGAVLTHWAGRGTPADDVTVFLEGTGNNAGRSFLVSFPHGAGTVFFASFHQQGANVTIMERVLHFIVHMMDEADTIEDLHEMARQLGFGNFIPHFSGHLEPGEVAGPFSFHSVGGNSFAIIGSPSTSAFTLTLTCPDGYTFTTYGGEVDDVVTGIPSATVYPLSDNDDGEDDDNGANEESMVITIAGDVNGMPIGFLITNPIDGIFEYTVTNIGTEARSFVTGIASGDIVVAPAPDSGRQNPPDPDPGPSPDPDLDYTPAPGPSPGLAPGAVPPPTTPTIITHGRIVSSRQASLNRHTRAGRFARPAFFQIASDTQAGTATTLATEATLEEDNNLVSGEYILVPVSVPQNVEVVVVQPTIIRIAIGSAEYTVNGLPRFGEAAPFIDADTGRTMVSLDFVSEALNTQVDWLEETRTISILRNGQYWEIQLDTPLSTDMGTAVLVGDHIFVPLAYITQLLDAHIRWDGNARAVYITR